MLPFSLNISTQFLTRLSTGADAVKIKLSESQKQAMLDYTHQLIQWNKKINLTAIRDVESIAEKHFLDSIIPAQYIDKDARVADFGSGGGFPGIPLKIVRPDLDIFLIDSVRKKVNFLKHVIRTLELENIDAYHTRIEDLKTSHPKSIPFDVVISRAFTELERFVKLSLPYLKDNGCILAMKGKNATDEITPWINENFAVTSFAYKLPFEQSDRKVIKLIPNLLNKLLS